MASCTDVVRGKTVHVRNDTAADIELKVELCSGACVYSYTLSAASTLETPDADTPLVTLNLQDSAIELYPDQCGVCADLPGLKWPGNANLVIAPGSRVTLNLTYGNCS